MVKRSETPFKQGNRLKTFLGANFMRGQVLALPEEKTTKRLLIFCWVSLLFSGVLIGFSLQRIPREVPLFYSRAWGREQLVSPLLLFLPILLAGGFILLNSFLSARVKSFTFFRKAVLLGAGAGAILTLITIIRILALVI